MGHDQQPENHPSFRQAVDLLLRTIPSIHKPDVFCSCLYCSGAVFDRADKGPKLGEVDKADTQNLMDSGDCHARKASANLFQS